MEQRRTGEVDPLPVRLERWANRDGCGGVFLALQDQAREACRRLAGRAPEGLEAAMGRLASPHPFLPVRVGTTVSVTGDAWDLHLAAVQDGVILGVLSGGDELPHRWMSSWATKAAKALEQTTVPLPFVVEGSRSTDA